MEEKLPNVVTPHIYRIHVRLDMVYWRLEGSVTIRIQILKPVKEICLNISKLNIKKVSFESSIAKFHADLVKEILVCEFENEISPCEGDLMIEYDGAIQNQLQGCYRCQTCDDKGEETKMIVTHFQPTHARSCFPCWDDPRRKAKFILIVTTAMDYDVLSNTKPTSKIKTTADLVTVEFSPTPIMSPYLLAFIVGKFDYVEKIQSSGMVLRVYTPIGASREGEFALDIADKMITFYERFFCIDFPLQKMDLVSVPELSPDAMENWGLMLFRESALLINPKESCLSNRREVATIISHEFAHQWFGNLVTMRWWNELWLNEGFANFLMYLSLNDLDSQMTSWTMFLEKEWHLALKLDGLRSTHPLQQMGFSENNDIMESFDTVTYSKGAAVIRMIYEYIGSELFRESLKEYLKRFRYSTSTSEDLWLVFDEITSLPVSRIMSSWTKNEGYPVIEVTMENKRLLLEQKQFMFNGACDPDKRWMVPIIMSWNVPEQRTHKMILTEQKMALPVCTDCRNIGLKVNFRSTGYYRVKYDIDVLKTMVNNSKTMTVDDRIGILDDTFALACAGYYKTIHAIELGLNLSCERNLMLWSCLDEWLQATISLIEDTPYGKASAKDFMLRIYGKLLEDLKWNAFDFNPKIESRDDRLLYALVLFRLGQYGHPQIVHEAQNCFWNHVESVKVVPPEFRACLYATVLKYGDLRELNAMMKLKSKSDLLEEKLRIIRSLGYVPMNLFDQILDYSFSGTIRSQDVPQYLIFCCTNPKKAEKVWDFVKFNWGRLLECFNGSFGLCDLIDGVCSSLLGEKAIEDVKDFFQKHPTSGISQSISIGIDNILMKTRQKQRDGNEMLNYITSKIAK